MDELDLQIIKLLIFNSRLSYREIAGYIKLSLNAVYKRVQNLIDMGVIRRFKATINSHTIGAIYAIIFGKSDAREIDKVVAKLEENEHSSILMLSSRNYIYIGALLKSVHELGEFTNFVSLTAEIQSPVVGLRSGSYYKCPISFNIPKTRTLNIDKLDMTIIKSLHNDARKAISDVADDVGRTPNTVRRRLSRLEDEALIELTIDFYPEASGDVYSVLLIKLKPTIDKDQIIKRLVDENQPFILYCWTFSNLPNTLLCWVWTNTINELNSLLEKVKSDEIDSIITDIIRKGWFLDTWIEKLLEKEKIEEI